MTKGTITALAGALLLAGLAPATAQEHPMGFFVTSVGPGNGRGPRLCRGKPPCLRCRPQPENLRIGGGEPSPRLAAEPGILATPELCKRPQAKAGHVCAPNVQPLARGVPALQRGLPNAVRVREARQGETALLRVVPRPRGAQRQLLAEVLAP